MKGNEKTIVALMFTVLALGLTWTYYGPNIQGYIAGAAVIDVYFIDPPPTGHHEQLNYAYILMNVSKFVWVPVEKGEKAVVACDVDISLKLSANGLEFVKGYDNLFVVEGKYKALHIYVRNITAYDENNEPILYFNRTLPIKIVFDKPAELVKGKEYNLFIDIYCTVSKGKTLIVTEHNIRGTIHANATLEDTSTGQNVAVGGTSG